MTETVEVKQEINQEEVDESQRIIQATEGPLKEMLVNYVGGVMRPEDGQVTVNMIVEAIASEFPEFLFVVARENFIRGYEQALADIENVEKEKQESALKSLKESKKKKSTRKPKKK